MIIDILGTNNVNICTKGVNMERLKQLREAKNYTQQWLSMQVGVSQETISGYEIGKAVPPADMLVKLADVLRTSVDYLLGRTDVKEFDPICQSDLTERERELLERFRALPEEKKERAVGMMMGLGE